MKKIIPTPHDRFFREAMTYPRVAKQFFESYLPANIRSVANLDTLQLRKDSYLDEELQLSTVDMLYSVELNAKKGYFYILVEHQSKADALMPFRLMKYVFSIMEQHLKEHPGNELPLICPIVLYNGKGKYPYTTDIFELFKSNKALAHEVFLAPFQLVDLSQIPDTLLREKAWLSVLLMCLKHTMDREDALRWIEPMLDNICVIEKEGGDNLAKTSFNYLFDSGEVSNPKQLMQTIRTHLSPTLGGTVMATIAQKFRELFREEAREEGLLEGRQKGLLEGRQKGLLEGRQQGRQEGRQEGIEQGRHQAMQELAIQLMQEKVLPAEKIAKMTGVPLETLLKETTH